MEVNVSNLYFDYFDKNVLNDISFSVNNSDVLLILGHNGAGKTTLINILLKKLKAKSGNVYYDKVPIDEFNDFTKIGYVPQEVEVSGFPITVKEFLLTFNRSHNIKEVDKVLQKLDIMHLKNKSMLNLSGGEKRRVYIARSMLNEISLLIMDEPLTAIDKSSIERVRHNLAELKELNIPIIIVTHNFFELKDIATHVLELENGVKFFGTKEEYIDNGGNHGTYK